MVRLRVAGAHSRRFSAMAGTGGFETRPYNSHARTRQTIKMSKLIRKPDFSLTLGRS